MDRDASLGSVLCRLREVIGLTQEDLADRAGVSARTISDIERGLRRSIYRDTADRLADALGLEGDARAHFKALARGRGAGGARSPTPTGPNAAGAIPPQPTRLIGREDELKLIFRGLSDARIKLLTIAGPGGIGKTRLAAEAATRAQALFDDGVFFVSLATVDRAGLVPTTIAGAIGLPPLVDPNAEAIARHLESNDALLVLDTFEHVLDAASDVAHIVTRCSGVKALVTTREALRVRGEHVVPLAALSLPPERAQGPGRSAAVELFVERACAAKPDLRIDEETAASIVDICRRLGGLPLAIELAAARTRHVSIAALRDRLTAQLSILTTGPRDLPRRQRTMRDTIAWSYDRLTAAEQSLFRAVSIFAGGWTVDAAAHIWQDHHGDEVFETLSALVDKSLVVVSEDGDDLRYTMLDVISEYAYEVARETGEMPDLERRHCDYFVTMAERAEPEFRRANNDLWYVRLTFEHDNFRRALQWALSKREADLAVRIAGAIWQFWRARGHYSEGRTWLRQALALGGTTIPARAKALWGAGWLALHQGDLDDAEQWSRELLSLTEHDANSRSGRNALTIQGMIALAREDVDKALGALQRSVEICDDLGDAWLLATSRLNLALALVHAERPGDTYVLLDEALSVYRDLGDRRFAARTDAYRGYAALSDGLPEQARDLFAGSIARFDEVGDAAGVAEGLEGLAAVCAVTGSGRQAAALMGAAEAIRRGFLAVPLPFEQVLLDRYLVPARAALEVETWESAREQGSDMNLDDAINLVSAETRGGPHKASRD